MGTHDQALTYEAKDAETQSITTVYSHMENVHGLVITVWGLARTVCDSVGRGGSLCRTRGQDFCHPLLKGFAPPPWDLLSCPLVWGVGSPGGLVPRQVSAFGHFP